jgi:hypothetical protein
MAKIRKIGGKTYATTSLESGKRMINQIAGGNKSMSRKSVPAAGGPRVKETNVYKTGTTPGGRGFTSRRTTVKSGAQKEVVDKNTHVTGAGKNNFVNTYGRSERPFGHSGKQTVNKKTGNAEDIMKGPMKPLKKK